jgi:hypothetical protein
MKLRTTLALSLASAFLAACGGGGGGVTAITAPVATAALSSTNQDIAAQEASSTAFLPLFGAQTLTGAQTTDESALFKIARAQLDKLPTYLTEAQSNNALIGAVQSQTYNCTSGGSLSVSVSDADNNGVISAGDSATITGNNCVESGETISGSLGLVINSLSGVYGSTSYSAGITMTFNGLSVASPQYSASMSGSLSLTAVANGVNSLSQTLSTPSLTVSATYAGVTRSRSLTTYSATATRSPNTTYGYLDTYTASGVLTSTALSSQTITFNTTTPFVARPSDDYPSSGVMVITGAANSQLKLTALSNTQVRQELDANGDGTYESSTTVNWNTLL